MNKKNMQKLNRAAVAAVLAAGGVAVTVPFPVAKAASPFTDITMSDTHYDAIMSLYNRNIISGYEDNTFRPNKTVTRGQAAKMLALTLGLDVNNVKNPGFKDVSINSGNYKYIAALAELNVISGFADKTFRPQQPITRSQMAKILVKGFEFMEATSLTHNFTDVSAKNANRFYIQTLVNLGITTGTSSVTYSPAKHVTRGQLASFLVRAENANVSTAKIKEVTKVEIVKGITYVYLNGVKHTVASSLKNIFNTTNAEVLKGAYVDGTIVGTDIRNVTKLTINANGTANNILKFNGSNSTFKGDVDVTGNYIRFSNWNVAGELTIMDAEMTAVSNIVKPIQLNTVASLTNKFSFIDWGQTTDPAEINPDNDLDEEIKEDLVDIPTDNKAPLPTLSKVAKHIEFVNTTVQELIIKANRTYVKSDKKLQNVTVAGFVYAFEIIADIKALYLDTDVDTKFYGVADIETIYKNGYKSVDLYADSITGLIVADNSNGWIDLGDYFYVDKAIIPPNTMPNEIFNDFLNDTDKIGDIEDPLGNEIDRDPIENVIVPDWEAPTLTIKNIKTNLASATITVNSTEDGTVYYVVRKEIDGDPSIREIMQYTGKMGGHMPVTEGTDTNITMENLEDETSYIFYAVAVDEAGNVSVKKSEKFDIVDATPPVIKPVEAKGLPGGKRIEVTMNPNEAGEYFYYYEPVPLTGAYTYTAQQILDFAGTNYQGRTGKGTVSAAGEVKFRIEGLPELTNYAVYVVMKDKAGNVMAEAERVTAWTTELDDVHPYVKDAELYRVKNDEYEFEFYVNEALDPKTANDINNYEISGTAIINVDGQQTTIKPDYVEYVEGSKKVKIRIPSATALVNGDTIVVKVLPGVTDLAENPFVNLNVVTNATDLKNTASYVHNDSVTPTLQIENFQPNPLKTNGILTYKANKAGTYYYMIVPNSYDMSKVSPRQFYSEFTGEYMLPERIPNLTKQGDIGNNTVVVGSQAMNVLLPDSDDPFESYSLYMVVKDRSGQLSTIEKVLNVIDDSKAPFVRKLEVTPEEGSNKGVNIKISASEAGRVYYTRYDLDSSDPIVQEKIKEIQQNWHSVLKNDKSNHKLLNSEDAKKIVSEIRTWKDTELKGDTITDFYDRGLSEHTNYIYFFAVEDLFDNITMYPSQLSASPTGNVEENYANNVMSATVYTDGIKPYIEGNVMKLTTKQEFKNIPLAATSATGTIGDGYIEHQSQKTFAITFSEAIKISNSTQNTPDDKEVLQALKNVIEPKLHGLTITDMEWQDRSTIGTWEERKLIFTISDKPTTDIAITASDLVDFKDLADKAFSVDKTNVLYKTRLAGKINGLRGAVLGGSPVQTNDNPNVFQSDSIIATLEVNADLTLVQEYYYIIQNATDNQVYTPEEIVSYVKGYRDGVSGVFTYGSGNIEADAKQILDATNGASFKVEIVARGNNVFSTGQKLHLVTMDQYGNIVSSQTDPDTTGKVYPYIAIQRIVQN